MKLPTALVRRLSQKSVSGRLVRGASASTMTGSNCSTATAVHNTDHDGWLIGTLEMPDGVDLLEAGEDYVLGPWRDELDVGHVRLYELVKP